MKNVFLKMLATTVIASSFVVPTYAADTYTLDPMHSYALFHINHFGFSNPSGKWLANGTLILDETKPQDSKIDVTINVADVITGIPKLDEHLRKAEFFDVDKFPKATFVSDKITMTGKDSAKVHGMLTIRGVSKPITLMVKMNKLGVNPITQKKTVGFTASTTLKRSDYEVSAYLPALGDEVKINIEAEAVKSS